MGNPLLGNDQEDVLLLILRVRAQRSRSHRRPGKILPPDCFLVVFDARFLVSQARDLSSGIADEKWRTGWDSNPRRACTLGGFQDRCIRPLCHLSAWPFGPGRTRPSAINLKAQNILWLAAAGIPDSRILRLLGRMVACAGYLGIPLRRALCDNGVTKGKYSCVS